MPTVLKARAISREKKYVPKIKFIWERVDSRIIEDPLDKLLIPIKHQDLWSHY